MKTHIHTVEWTHFPCIHTTGKHSPTVENRTAMGVLLPISLNTLALQYFVMSSVTSKYPKAPVYAGGRNMMVATKFIMTINLSAWYILCRSPSQEPEPIQCTWIHCTQDQKLMQAWQFLAVIAKPVHSDLLLICFAQIHTYQWNL